MNHSVFQEGITNFKLNRAFAQICNDCNVGPPSYGGGGGYGGGYQQGGYQGYQGGYQDPYYNRQPYQPYPNRGSFSNSLPSDGCQCFGGVCSNCNVG